MKVSKKVPTIAYTILCVFLLFALIAGIKYIVELGNRLEETDYTSNSKIDWDNNSTNDDFKINGSGQKTQQLSISAKSYEIDIPYGDVLITQTDKDPYVTFDSKRDIEIQTREDEGHSRLKVSAKMDLFNGLGIDEDDIKINFYLPKDKLTSLDVNFSAGILKISNINADDFCLHMSAGNAVIKNCEFDKIKTDLDAGNLELYINEETKIINSDVSAGNMKLMLPKDIKGFDIQYDVDLGNITNNLSFNIGSSSKGFVIGKSGKFSYGDKSCEINFDVAVGNISLNEY